MFKILVAEDSKLERTQIVDHLKDLGFNDIIEAESGEQTLELFAKENPDLVFLDVFMPGINGMDVLFMFQKKAKVVILSSSTDESLKERAGELGAIEWFDKPIDDSFKGRMDNFLKQFREYTEAGKN